MSGSSKPSIVSRGLDGSFTHAADVRSRAYWLGGCVRVVVFQGFDCPDVEVQRDGEWHSGELRSWHQTETGWDAMVQYNVGPGMIGSDPLEVSRVRPA